MPEIVEETINLHFLRAAEALLASAELQGIHAMTDVTNGGLRGDIHEMAGTAGCRVRVHEEKVRPLVNPKVAAMLENLAIDYLGISIDALLVTAPPEAADGIRRVIRGAGVRIEEIGSVEKGTPEAVLVIDGKETDFSPRFRESAYTPLKKVVEYGGRSLEEMKAGVDRAAEAAIAKKRRVMERLRRE
jgi:hydrogenase expression/formation protein